MYAPNLTKNAKSVCFLPLSLTENTSDDIGVQIDHTKCKSKSCCNVLALQLLSITLPTGLEINKRKFLYETASKAIV